MANNAHTYMEEADEDGNPIDDTKTYVSTAPPSLKEEANVSRTRKEKLRRKDSSSPAAANFPTDSESTPHLRSPLRRESKKAKDKSREKDRSSSKKAVTYASRPTAKSSKTVPNIHTSSLRRPQEEASHYGVSPTGVSPILMAANSNSARPRAYTASQRPTSYYGQPSRPPPANARYWQQTHHAPGSSYPAPGTSYPAPGTSYPPQAFYPPPPPTAPPFQSPFPPPSPMGPPPVDYFSPNLSSRFDPHRPQSAMARPAIAYGPEYDEQDEGGALIRQPSLTRRRSTRHEDRIRMPPPHVRPNTTRPHSVSVFAPPALKRRSIESNESMYDDESADEDDDSMYHNMSPPDQYQYRPHPVRRPSIDSTVIYEMGPRYTDIAGRRSRRNSTYGARNQSTERDVQDKVQSALRYQQDQEGNPIDPLTTDSLRRLAKTPSGGTKSSGSRDESGYGRSTATTRNTYDNEDITILVKNTGQLSID
ncbi:hypothetical protein VMCG_02891 [Cytospora schulzeri]|uniref:Uncharacterized protein n=1 Tax=Cytospora schulzeri TaxID=448051 RepID=A0A423WZ77_9PEZI|nr:hypothetical protein VMCG_02891 [Valsa malicola]